MARDGNQLFAPDLDAFHEETPVFLFHDVPGFKGLRETRPSGPRVELVEGTEQGLTGYDVHVNAFSVIIPYSF